MRVRSLRWKNRSCNPLLPRCKVNKKRVSLVAAYQMAVITHIVPSKKKSAFDWKALFNRLCQQLQFIHIKQDAETQRV